MNQADLQALDDLSLMRLFQEGQTEGLTTLLRRRQVWLYNVAKKTVSNPVLAEDGLQEALVQIWKAASTFRGDSQVSTWMYQIVVRSCIDVLRKEKVRAAEVMPEGAENLFESPSQFESKLVDELLVHGALSELEPEQKTIIQMVWLDGLSYEEVSESLGIPIGTVKSRASRAMTKLKIILNEILSESGNKTETSYVKETEVNNVRYFRRRN